MDQQQEEHTDLKRLLRERNWMPILLGAGSFCVGYLRGEYISALGIMDTFLLVGLMLILWSILDIRVMIARHYWSMMRR